RSRGGARCLTTPPAGARRPDAGSERQGEAMLRHLCTRKASPCSIWDDCLEARIATVAAIAPATTGKAAICCGNQHMTTIETLDSRYARDSSERRVDHVAPDSPRLLVVLACRRPTALGCRRA